MSAFNGDPSSPAAKQLPRLIAAMKAERADLVNAPAIVLDLRGNTGGSSDWSRQIAAILWGAGRVARIEDHSYVEWRASDANIAFMSRQRDAMRKSGAPSPEVINWFDSSIAGMRDAARHGTALWREPPEPIGKSAADDLPPLPKGPVYVITDAGCGSACLDAADLWRALGAIQVGAQTSADTNYMEVREAVLPSGLARIAVPMKVYRQRERGSNAPLDPVHVYVGDLRDTPTLERWIISLPEVHRRRTQSVYTRD
jgi:hypothetical protein